MNNSAFTSFHFNLRKVNEGIGEMTLAKNEMDDYVNDIMENTKRMKSSSSLFEYCTALDQMLTELMVRAQGIAYGSENIMSQLANLKLMSKFIPKEYEEEKERVYSQYSLSDINFVSILNLLNELKYMAVRINYSNTNWLFNLTANNNINAASISGNLSRMVESSTKVNSNLQSIFEGRKAAQEARWSALTEQGKKIAEAVKSNNTFEPEISGTGPSQSTTGPTTNTEPETKPSTKLDPEKEESGKNEEPTITPIEKPEEENKSEEKENNTTKEPENNNSNQENNNNTNNNNVTNSPAGTVRENPNYVSNGNQNVSEIPIPEGPKTPEPTTENPEPNTEEPEPVIEPITINATPAVTETQKQSGLNLGTVLAGVGATAAAGIGAKVYLDNKKNNDTGEETTDEEMLGESIDNEIEPNTDGITAEVWQDEEPMPIIEDENGTNSDLNEFGEM